MCTARRSMFAGLLATFALFSACEKLRSTPPPPARETVEIAGRRFSLETADDDSARTRGLMGRTRIAPDGGMLFVFRSARIRQFWMGYCLVDIDIIFLDPQGRVTATHRMKTEAPRRGDESEPDYRARLQSYSSILPSQFAIELQAGTLDRSTIKVDDRIALDLPRLKALAR